MIKLPDRSLPPETQSGLDKLQKQINKLKKYEQRVAEAKKLFAKRNKANDKIFKFVRAMLEEMCSGPRRCAYCEDSEADEVEHVKPKDLYPEVVFVWGNYVYACGHCNRLKSNQFAVFSRNTGKLVVVTRKAGDPIVPPELGDPVMINPRREDPLDFMQPDLLGTFEFGPYSKAKSEEQERGDYTIKLLRLNKRKILPELRQIAYEAFVDKLERYIKKRDGGASRAEPDRIIRFLQRMNHQAVWQEIKRRYKVIPELKALFDQAPEALDW